LKKLLAWPSIASKNWVYRQYDHQVRDGSWSARQRRGSDSHQDGFSARDERGTRRKVGDPKVSEKLIAMTVDCNGGYVYLDPYEGAKAAVAEACRNLACSGAIPLGATDNLNMPSPLKPELFWQIAESVRGLAEGCKAFQRARHRRQLLALQSKPRRPD
jgi:phosphoribosylformylglycinamidine synthase